jgi:hypothetical protein
MTTNGQQPTLAELARQCVHDSERWFGDTVTMDRFLPHHTLALAGEVGELANIVKKIDRGSLNLNDPAVHRELVLEATDVLVYLMNIFGRLNVDPFVSYTFVRRANNVRFLEQRQKREGQK